MAIRPVSLTQRGFSGMLDTLDPAADATKAFLLLNCDIQMGAPTLRFGWSKMSSTSVGSGLGDGLTYEWAKLDGTLVRVVVSGGQIYTCSTAFVPTLRITTAQLGSASITLSSTNAVYCVPFNNQLVFTDGVNTPFMWDGTAGSGLTKLTNAPVAFGAPTVFDASLIFIKNTDRGTIVWSEVNAANTGYEAGYANAWTLGQTGSQPLCAVMGTNEGLYYWRSGGIGLIRGAIGSTFATTATHDAVSDRIGHNGLAGTTTYRGVPLYYNNSIYFTDQWNNPWRIRPGGALQDLSEGAERRFLSLGAGANAPYYLPFNVGEDTSQTIYTLQIVPVPMYGRVMFVYNGGVTTVTGLLMDEDTGVLAGVYVFPATFTGCIAPAVVDPAVAKSSCLFSVAGHSGVGSVVVALGYITGGAGTIGSDQDDSATTSYTATVVGPVQGYDEATEWHFDEIDVAFAGAAAGAQVSVDYLTDQTPDASVMAVAQTSTLGTVVNAMKEQRALFGIRGFGSWIRVRVRMTSTQWMALRGWRITAYPAASVAVRVP